MCDKRNIKSTWQAHFRGCYTLWIFMLFKKLIPADSLAHCQKRTSFRSLPIFHLGDWSEQSSGLNIGSKRPACEVDSCAGMNTVHMTLIDSDGACFINAFQINLESACGILSHFITELQCDNFILFPSWSLLLLSSGFFFFFERQIAVWD